MAVSEIQQKTMVSHLRTARTLMLWVGILLINLAWPALIQAPADRHSLFQGCMWGVYLSAFYLFGITAWRTTRGSGPVYYFASSVGIWALTVFSSVSAVSGAMAAPGAVGAWLAMTSVIASLLGALAVAIWIENAGNSGRAGQEALRAGFVVASSGFAWGHLSVVEGAVGLIAMVALWSTLRIWLEAGYVGQVPPRTTPKEPTNPAG